MRTTLSIRKEGAVSLPNAFEEKGGESTPLKLSIEFLRGFRKGKGNPRNHDDFNSLKREVSRNPHLPAQRKCEAMSFGGKPSKPRKKWNQIGPTVSPLERERKEAKTLVLGGKRFREDVCC